MTRLCSFDSSSSDHPNLHLPQKSSRGPRHLLPDRPVLPPYPHLPTQSNDSDAAPCPPLNALILASLAGSCNLCSAHRLTLVTPFAGVQNEEVHSAQALSVRDSVTKASRSAPAILNASANRKFEFPMDHKVVQNTAASPVLAQIPVLICACLPSICPLQTEEHESARGNERLSDVDTPCRHIPLYACRTCL